METEEAVDWYYALDRVRQKLDDGDQWEERIADVLDSLWCSSIYVQDRLKMDALHGD